MSKNSKNIAPVSTSIENQVEGLETAQESTVQTSTNPNYQDLEYLKNNEPVIVAEHASSKYDTEREPKVQNGLHAISELLSDKVNPLVILLGKWWEVKPARKFIKEQIDAEAERLSKNEDVYLQVELRENVDKLAEIQSAVDRLRYAITYFKPRGGIKSKEIFKNVKINGETYAINMTKYNEAIELFGSDKEQIKKFLLECSEKVEIEEIL